MHIGANAVEAILYKPAPYLYNKLNEMVDNLDNILRALEIYLESKRQIFPRFYFISNDDLLEILGNSKKPQLVQVHLKKLFDNVNKIRIDKVSSYNVWFNNISELLYTIIAGSNYIY